MNPVPPKDTQPRQVVSVSLPKDWQERVKKVWAKDYTAPLYGFTPERPQMNPREMAAALFPCTLDDRDPLSRAILPPIDAHGRDRVKAFRSGIREKCFEILKSTYATEAANALFKAADDLIESESELVKSKREEDVRIQVELKAYDRLDKVVREEYKRLEATQERRKLTRAEGEEYRRLKAKFDMELRKVRQEVGDIHAGSWCRVLANSIRFVALLSCEDKRGEPRRISPDDARQTAKALEKKVQRYAGSCLIQDPTFIKAGIARLKLLANSGRSESRKTTAMITLTDWHQQALRDPVDVAIVALVKAAFGGKPTMKSLQSTRTRWLEIHGKKPKSGE